MQHMRRLLRLPYKEFNFISIRVLDKTKFAILFVVITLVFLIGLPYYGLSSFQTQLNAPFEQVCPARPMFVYFQQFLGWEAWSTGVPTLSVFALGFFFIMTFTFRKFWCRICPVGAINSFFNKHALLTLQKDGSKCTKCRICLRACPMDIEEIYEEKGKTNISSKECIHCYRCVELCPEDNCLSVAFLEKKLLNSKSPYKKTGFKLLKINGSKLFQNKNSAQVTSGNVQNIQNTQTQNIGNPQFDPNTPYASNTQVSDLSRRN
jgi:polyferredoxin